MDLSKQIIDVNMKIERQYIREQAKLRRKRQVCRVYEVKIDKSSLSKEKLEYFERLFLEAKWWYNYILRQGEQNNIFVPICKTTIIKVMNKDEQLEDRELKYLCHRMRRKIHEKIMTNISSLSTSKKKGRKVGRLKFKSFVNTIPGEFVIKDNDYLKITGFKKYFKVRGLDQISKDAEIRTIELIRKHSDYYFHITTYQSKTPQITTNQYIGIDLGIKDTLTFSNGVKADIKLPITKEIMKAHKNVSRKQKHSKNRHKARIKLQKVYDKRNNQKQDTCNKVIHFLKSNYDYISVQNDPVSEWQQQYKKVNESIIGRTVGNLKKLPKTIIVDRFFPSTKLCPICNVLTTLTLDDRVFNCQSCGYEEDRDIKAAKLILLEGMKDKVPMEYGDLKLVENETSVAMHEYMKSIPHIKVSLVR